MYRTPQFCARKIAISSRSTKDKNRLESGSLLTSRERVYRTAYATKSQARSDVIRYIEGFYNSRRRHSALGYRRPDDVQYGYHQPALAA
jgi:transposase InsO family protein